MIANGFLLVSLVTGTLGYMFIEGWSLADSFYMTFITMTTIGFAEVHELSSAGRLFTIFVGLTGIGGVAFVATRTAQVLLNTTAFRHRTIMKKIESTSDHYILAGFGRIGNRIAEDLERHGVPFVIIEKDDKKYDGLLHSKRMFVHGNAEDEQVLAKAGIERAKGLILTLPEDRANVFATLVARELNPDLFILVRTDTHTNKRKLIRAGADKVIAPYEIGADRMAQVLLRPHLDRFMERVLQSGSLNYTMDEVQVQPNSLLADKSLVESHFRQRFDAMVVAIMDFDTLDMTFNPGPEHRIKPNDTLIVMGSIEMIQRLRTDGCTSL